MINSKSNQNLKILLLHPPTTSGDRWDKSFKDIGSIQLPLGLAYIAAVLKEAGKDVTVLDAAVLEMDLKRFREEIKRIGPDIVGITAMTPMIKFAGKAAEIIKEVRKEVIVVLGGPHISVLPEETLRTYPIDYGVVGEGEYTFLELVNCLEKNEDVKEIKNIVFLKDNQFIFTGSGKVIDDLDALPFPARELFPNLKFYKSAIGNYKRLPVGTMMSSRGCPFNCTYCDKSIFGRGIRLRSAKNVVDEMEQLHTKFGVNEIIFFDDIFTMNKKRVYDICEEIRKRKLDISWNCEAHVRTIELDLLRKMKKAGCWQISYGVESGNQKILDNIKKGIKLQEIEDAVRLTKKAGILARGYFILGLPGETKESIQDTINFAKKLKLNNALFSMLVPFPGTELYNDIKNFGKITQVDWSNFRMTTTEPIFVPDALTKEELKRFSKKAYKSFYMSPGFIFRYIKNIRSFNDIKAAVDGFLTVKKI